MQVLNCPVDEAMWRRWEAHFAPQAQPFFLSEDCVGTFASQVRWTRREFGEMRTPLSLNDTFQLYEVSAEATWALWLDDAAFFSLSASARRLLLEEQRRLGRGGVVALDDWLDKAGPADSVLLEAAADDGSFVWWTSLWRKLTPALRRRVLLSFVASDRLPCERHNLSEEHWQEVDARFPAVRSLAGTFVSESGANCLSTVVAACGVPAVAEVWLHPAPFSRWLETRATETNDFDALGTVLVWRSQDEVQHAALCLGDGWALHKEAQAWFAPRQVTALSDVRKRWDAPDSSVTGYAVEWSSRKR